MQTQPIVSLLKADPFRPFAMHTVQRERYVIRQRVQLKVTPNGVLYYFSPPEDDETTAGSVTTINAADVVSIDVNCP